MKKLFICLMSLLMVFTLAACGGGDSSSGGGNKKPNQDVKDNPDANTLAGINLEVAVNFTGNAQTTFASICSAFENRYGATITIDWYGADYATLMTTRMAANTPSRCPKRGSKTQMQPAMPQDIPMRPITLKRVNVPGSNLSEPKIVDPRSTRTTARLRRPSIIRAPERPLLRELAAE